MREVNSSERIVTGGCLCGRIRFTVNGPLRAVLVCHCAMCRRLMSSVGAFTACAVDDLVVTAGKVKYYRSSPIARRGFCAACGANLFWAPDHGRHLSIALGSLDVDPGLPIEGHIYVDGTPDRHDAPAG